MQTVKCPTCKAIVKWDTANPYRPFCCERCKLIDLGAWADGSYAIPDRDANPEDLIDYDINPDEENE